MKIANELKGVKDGYLTFRDVEKFCVFNMLLT